MPSREIARTIGRSNETINRYLASCGRMVDGAYHLNALMAKALFTEQELAKLGALERALLGWPWSECRCISGDAGRGRLLR